MSDSEPPHYIHGSKKLAETQELPEDLATELAHKREIYRIWEIMGELFELEERYKIKSFLGSGAYGAVCAVYDSKKNMTVAIKKCKQVFQSKTLTKRTIREIKLLRMLGHDNVVKLVEIISPKDMQRFSDLYIVFEIMETDLATIIRSSQSLLDRHIQYFTYQLISGLTYIHGCNVVHRDLKPRNLLVNADCKLKIADFGLARFYKDGKDRKVSGMTEYVTTRWYRAPEILVGWCEYTNAVDMWAAGCIVTELVSRSPVFPGSDTRSQLDIICKVLGKFPSSFIEKSKSEEMRRYIKKLPSYKANALHSLFPRANRDAMELAQLLLEFDPSARLRAGEALWHPYLASMSTASGVHEMHKHCSTHIVDELADEFTFENQADAAVYYEELLKEMQHYEIRLQSTEKDESDVPLSSRIGADGNGARTVASTVDRAERSDVKTGRRESMAGDEWKAAPEGERCQGITRRREPGSTAERRAIDPNIFSSCVTDQSPAANTNGVATKRKQTLSHCIVA